MNRAPVKSGPDSLIVWEALLRVSTTLIQTLERELVEGEHLPLSWYDVFVQLSLAKDGRLRMQALADSVVFSPSGLTRLVDRMEKAGMVKREHAKDDRRGYFVAITPKGRQTMAKARPLHHRGINEHFARYLTSGEMQSLYAILSKVRAGMANSRPDKK